MNDELLKTNLWEIIKEAQNLDSEDLERVEGTDIYVKKGRAKEFDVAAYNYYELTNNTKITPGIDYLNIVYNAIKNEVLDEDREYYESKTYELVSSTKTLVERLEALIGSLDALDSNYEKVTKDFNNTFAISNLEERKQKLQELNANINKLIDDKSSTIKEIHELQAKINAKARETIKEQMDFLVKSYINTKIGTKIAFGLDGQSILANDKNEYDSLYLLDQILAEEPTEDLAIIDNLFCVNQAKKEQVQELLKNIEIFKGLKIVPKKIETPEPEIEQPPIILPNDELITKIKDELKSLETRRQTKGSRKVASGLYVSLENMPEYNRLLEIEALLTRANASQDELVEIWGVAHVTSEDATKAQELMAKTKLFNHYNPEHQKWEENQKRIAELEAYLDKLAKKISDTKGTKNLDMHQTKQIGDKVWLVLKEDVKECNLIIDIISLLSSEPEDKLESVWDIGYVASKDVATLKKLANATNYFQNNIPRINENETKKAEIKQRLSELMARAEHSSGEKVPNGFGYILASDLEEFNLLTAMHNYLEASNTAEDLVEVDGVKINAKYLSQYQDIIAKLAAIDTLKESKSPEEKTEKPDVSAANEPYIKDLMNAVKVLEVNKKLHPEVVDKCAELIGYLEEIKSYFEKAKTAEDIVPVEKGYLSSADVEKYHETMTKYVKARDELKEQLRAKKEPPKKDVLNPTLNDEKIAKHKEAIAEMQSKYTDPTTSEYAKAQEVVSILEQINEILIKAKNSEDLIDIKDYYIDAADEEKFTELQYKYQDLYRELKPEENNKKDNNDNSHEYVNASYIAYVEDLIQFVMERTANLTTDLIADNGDVLPLVQAKKVLENLNQTKKILVDAETSDNLVEVDGAIIDAKYQGAYESLSNFIDAFTAKFGYQQTRNEQLMPINNGRSDDNPKRTKVTIRKLIPKAKEYFKKNRKKIIALGICLTIAGLSMSILPEVLIFANSCNAAAMPFAQGFFNSLSHIIASLSNITFSHGAWLNASGQIINAGVASTKAGSAMGLAALNVLCLVGSTGLGARIMTKDSNEERLQDHVAKSNIKAKFQRLIDSLRNRAANLNVTLDNFEEDLEESLEEGLEEAFAEPIEELEPTPEVPTPSPSAAEEISRVLIKPEDYTEAFKALDDMGGIKR